MRLLLSFLLAVFLAGMASAATPPAPTPQKIDQLLQLLQDPAVTEWLKDQKANKVAASSDSWGIAAWSDEKHQELRDALGAVPQIPAAIYDAAMRVRQDIAAFSLSSIVFTLIGLVAIGMIVEWQCRRRLPQPGSSAVRLLSILISSLAVALVFLVLPVPPLTSSLFLTVLAAIAVYRIASAWIGDAGLTQAERGRVRLFAAIALVVAVIRLLAEPLGIDPAAARAGMIGLSFCLLVLAAGMLWSKANTAIVLKALGTLFITILWIFWCVDLKGLFWVGVYAIILPRLMSIAGQTTAKLMTIPADSPGGILLVRGSRAAVVACAVAWLAVVFRLNPDSLSRQNTTVAAILSGTLRAVIVLLIADLLWQLAKCWIDKIIASSRDATELAPAEAAKRARFRTLLPIFRNALAVAVLVTAGLVVLAQIGVQVAPLIAGASIFGVAIGFGSQTLVKDVISGVFYMLDDAFRVGEYIQAKSYKGTVEGFSLRSVRLRHHRGPVFTVPFGELGAVENMSRDWAIDKFRISVRYDTDVEKARKLTKQIGAEMLADPELGPLFIEPLKMKGVEEFSDYGIVLSFGMMTVPGMQTYVRRKANVKIREAFGANGIEFAQPMVNVGGEDKTAGVAAAATAAATKTRQAELLKAASGEGEE